MEASVSQRHGTWKSDFRWICVGDSKGQYRGVVDCFAKTFRHEGIRSFYNGQAFCLSATFFTPVLITG